MAAVPMGERLRETCDDLFHAIDLLPGWDQRPMTADDVETVRAALMDCLNEFRGMQYDAEREEEAVGEGDPPPVCHACGGEEVVSLGVLATMDHWRCRSCGDTFYTRGA